MQGGTLAALPRVVISGDWKFALRDPSQPKKSSDKPGLVSLSAPSELEVDLGEILAGVLALGHLISYDLHMGSLDVSCTGGCLCRPHRLEGWHAQETSIFNVSVIDVNFTGVGGGCKLRLAHRQASEKEIRARIRKLKTASKGGGKKMEAASKFKVLSLMVPPYKLEGLRNTLKHSN